MWRKDKVSLPKAYRSVFKTDNEKDFAIFTFSYRTKLGDIEAAWDPSIRYPVYDGVSTFPFMYLELSSWLETEYSHAITSSRTNIYRNKTINCSHNNVSTFLFDWICPICLNQKSYFERHHVIAKRDGGVNGHENILDICKTCHQTITYGCMEDSWYMENAAFYHQLMQYGCTGALRESFLNHHYRSISENTESEKELIQKIMLSYILPEKEQEILQRDAKKEGKFFYQYYRDIALGLRSYKNEMKLENPELHKLFQEQFPWLWS